MKHNSTLATSQKLVGRRVPDVLKNWDITLLSSHRTRRSAVQLEMNASDAVQRSDGTPDPLGSVFWTKKTSGTRPNCFSLNLSATGVGHDVWAPQCIRGISDCYRIAFFISLKDDLLSFGIYTLISGTKSQQFSASSINMSGYWTKRDFSTIKNNNVLIILWNLGKGDTVWYTQGTRENIWEILLIVPGVSAPEVGIECPRIAPPLVCRSIIHRTCINSALTSGWLVLDCLWLHFGSSLQCIQNRCPRSF